MIEHLGRMRDAGVDAIKIEGRMKSLYYTAMVARAYRKGIDALEGKLSQEEARPYIDELDNVSHREFSTGFYFSRADADKTTRRESSAPYLLAGTIGKRVGGTERDWEFISMNKIVAGEPLDFLGPDALPVTDCSYELFDPETGERLEWVSHGHPCVIRTSVPLRERFIVRSRDPAWTNPR